MKHVGGAKILLSRVDGMGFCGIEFSFSLGVRSIDRRYWRAATAFDTVDRGLFACIVFVCEAL